MEIPETRPESLLALPAYLVGHVARIGHRLLQEALAEHELRLPHFIVLTALSDFGPLAQHEIAGRLGLNPSHLVHHLDDIEQRGLVARERDPDDRRRQQVALTPAGRALTSRLAQVADHAQEEFLQVLSEPERTTLVTLLRRVLDADDARPGTDS